MKKLDFLKRLQCISDKSQPCQHFSMHVASANFQIFIACFAGQACRNRFGSGWSLSRTPFGQQCRSDKLSGVNPFHPGELALVAL